jgi:hypothetical protein
MAFGRPVAASSRPRVLFFLSIGGDAIYLVISVLTSLPVKICVIIDALSSSRTCTFTVAVPLSHARVTVSLFFFWQLCTAASTKGRHPVYHGSYDKQVTVVRRTKVGLSVGSEGCPWNVQVSFPDGPKCPEVLIVSAPGPHRAVPERPKFERRLCLRKTYFPKLKIRSGTKVDRK